MVSKKVTIENPLGLHSRPATVFLFETKKFSCNIHFQKGERTFDGKSMLDILRSATKGGDEIVLICDGADETEALAALEKVISEGLGE